MESTILPTVIGSVASGLTSMVLSLFGQHAFSLKFRRSRETANRERLYFEFIEQVGKVYINALDGDLKKPSSLVPIYSLIGRMRLVSSERVLAAAEKVVEEILESWDRSAPTMQEIRTITKERRPVPMRDFTEACRAERSELSCI